MNDLNRIRDLAKETLEYANCDEMNRRRKLWSAHNSLHFTRPPIYIRAIPFDEFLNQKELVCENTYYRALEKNFLLNRYRMKIADDYIIEPFLTVRAVLSSAPNGVYGLPAEMGEKAPGECAAFKPSVIKESDIEKLQVADYKVDEQATANEYDRLYDVVGGILDVEVDRQGLLCGMWNNDISTILGKLRGLEQLMWDIYDRPEWLHRMLSFMQSKILMHMDQTEAANGFRLINHQNQAMPYAEELKPPQAGKSPVKPSELWGYVASQEFTAVGPEAFKEFMFDYQKPILERYGLAAYGCCEDLTRDIPVLKTLKNLRRISVSPYADVRKCAGQIGGEYIISWRPNPSSAVSYGLDENFVRKNLRETFDIFDANGCKFDITLKDVETVGRDTNRIIRWTQIVREEIEHRY